MFFLPWVLFDSLKRKKMDKFELAKILQTDPCLIPAVNDEGCNFRSLLGICETYCGRLLEAEQINNAYRSATNTGAMSDRCLVNRSQFILTFGFSLLGFDDLTGYDIGSTEGGHVHYWRWVKDSRIDATILKGRTKLGNYHFRQGDKLGNLVFDPRPDAAVVKELYQIFYQIKRTR